VPGLCAERCVLPRTLAAAEPPHPSNRHAQDGLPAYLEHRFANGQAEWVLALDQQRRFDPGCPIFANTDHRSPLDAIGLVLSGEAGAIRALIAEGRMQQGDTVYIRDGQAALGARLDRRL
jgi:sarcosine oxidase subunit alpha